MLCGFLTGFYDAYKDSYCDFELYTLLRRGLAAVVGVYWRNHPIIQGGLQLSISLVYLAVVHKWRPFCNYKTDFKIFKLHDTFNIVPVKILQSTFTD